MQNGSNNLSAKICISSKQKTHFTSHINPKMITYTSYKQLQMSDTKLKRYDNRKIKSDSQGP
jgi:hypothetical protein